MVILVEKVARATAPQSDAFGNFAFIKEIRAQVSDPASSQAHLWRVLPASGSARLTETDVPWR